MTRAMLTVLAAALGFSEGVFFFALLGFSVDAPFEVFTTGEWLDYPSLLFGGIGAISGAVLGWAAYAWAKKTKTYVSVPRRPVNAADPPYKGPFG